MKIEDFNIKTGNVSFRPLIVCNDGFTMSVQGSRIHYCFPREDQDWFTEMEIGFPSEKEDLILKYAEQEEIPTETVYGWVPVEIINKVIEKHGGINAQETFK